MKVVLVEDDDAVRNSTSFLLTCSGHEVEAFASGDAFLAANPDLSDACVLLDIRMPGTDGLAVLRILRERGENVPVVILTGHGDIPMAVEAMRYGAGDFLEKPYEPELLLQAIEAAAATRGLAVPTGKDPKAAEAVSSLSFRQRQVLLGILCGHPNKIIAYELSLSIRTVEAYRAQLLTKLRVRGTAEAVKLALAAGLDPAEFGQASPDEG